MLDGLGKKYNTPIVVEDTITRTGNDGRVYSGADNAYYDPRDGSIHVALDAEEGAYMFFAVHELVHKIETESPEMYTIFRDFVIDKLNANDLYAQLSRGEGNTFDERVASVMEWYAQNGVELTREQTESEIIADAIPVILTDRQTVQELVRADRTLAERIRDFFEEFFDELTQMVAQLAFGEANKAEVAALMDDQETDREIADLFTAALESTNNNGIFNTTVENGEQGAKYDGNPAESGESIGDNGNIRHSIGRATNGKPVAIVDDDIPAGVPKKRWAATVSQELRTRYPEGIRIANNAIRIISRTVGELTKSKYSQYLQTTESGKYAGKLGTTTIMDDVLNASTKWCGGKTGSSANRTPRSKPRRSGERRRARTPSTATESEITPRSCTHGSKRRTRKSTFRRRCRIRLQSCLKTSISSISVHLKTRTRGAPR